MLQHLWYTRDLDGLLHFEGTKELHPLYWEKAQGAMAAERTQTSGHLKENFLTGTKEIRKLGRIVIEL